MRGPRTAMKSGPRSPQLEKALAQKQRPNTAKNKYKNKGIPLKKKKKKRLAPSVYKTFVFNSLGYEVSNYSFDLLFIGLVYSVAGEL